MAVVQKLSLVLVLLWAGGGRAGVGYENPACDGKTVIVHLFEWRWTDVALECERFLAHAGYCGVQVSPPNEHLTNPPEYPYPWWQRYQPVSYKLVSRSGSEDEFEDMVRRCNAVGVRIFVDVVINHMAALGSEGVGSAGSSFDGAALAFPGVPFVPEDFTPPRLCSSEDGILSNLSSPSDMRNCALLGLADLYGASAYVREQVAGYLNRLVEVGVAGFRVDAARFMWPEDLAAILDLTNDLNTSHGFPPKTRPFVYLEVVNFNDGIIPDQDYYGLGRLTEFRYCQKVSDGLLHDLGVLGTVYDPDWGMNDPEKALVFVDNHDNQRGHNLPENTLSYKTPDLYERGVAFTLAQPYGLARVMSSYDFGDDTEAGPPHLPDYSTAEVVIDESGQCSNGWVCEHRWRAIASMVQFRNAVAGTEGWNLYHNDGHFLAFSRGSKGFFAMAKEGSVEKTVSTSLPPGLYEDLITCKVVPVTEGGVVDVALSENDPLLALCVGCQCLSPPGSQAQTNPVASQLRRPPASSPNRTVIFMHHETTPDQDVFIRGGIDAEHRPGCTEDAQTDACAVGIVTHMLGTIDTYDKYNSWRVGDHHLDWHGAEEGQGTYYGLEALGSPLAWTTNNPLSPAYQELNTFGDHYWMLDAEMDCSETEGGWVEVKAFVSNDGWGWEPDLVQETCSGSGGGSLPPYQDGNHFARCGYINVFHFGVAECSISEFPY